MSYLIVSPEPAGRRNSGQHQQGATTEFPPGFLFRPRPVAGTARIWAREPPNANSTGTCPLAPCGWAFRLPYGHVPTAAMPGRGSGSRRRGGAVLEDTQRVLGCKWCCAEDCPHGHVPDGNQIPRLAGGCLISARTRGVRTESPRAPVRICQQGEWPRLFKWAAAAHHGHLAEHPPAELPLGLANAYGWCKCMQMQLMSVNNIPGPTVIWAVALTFCAT